MGLGSHQGNAWRRLVGGLNLTSMESGWRLVIVAPFSHNDSNLLREFGTTLVAWERKAERAFPDREFFPNSFGTF
jgi:hypothetical protein